MERTKAWLEKQLKSGLADVEGEGRNWATVRFFHHKTGWLVHRETVFFV